MNIGDVVAMTGFSAKMIRHYEINGLMRTPGRTKRGYRTYSHDDVHRLQFIQCARELGLTCQEVRDLLLLWDDRKRSSAKLKSIARDYVARFEKKYTHLADMIATLNNYVDARAPRSDTPVLIKRHGGTTSRF